MLINQVCKFDNLKKKKIFFQLPESDWDVSILGVPFVSSFTEFYIKNIQLVYKKLKKSNYYFI